MRSHCLNRKNRKSNYKRGNRKSNYKRRNRKSNISSKKRNQRGGVDKIPLGDVSAGDDASRLALCVLGGVMYNKDPGKALYGLYENANADLNCDVIVIDPGEEGQLDVMSQWPNIERVAVKAEEYDFCALLQAYEPLGGVCIVNNLHGRDFERYRKIWVAVSEMVEEAIKQYPKCSVCSFNLDRNNFVQMWPVTLPSHLHKRRGYAWGTRIEMVQQIMRPHKAHRVEFRNVVPVARELNRAASLTVERLPSNHKPAVPLGDSSNSTPPFRTLSSSTPSRAVRTTPGGSV